MLQFLKKLLKSFTSSRVPVRTKQRPKRGLSLEQLETRDVPSAFFAVFNNGSMNGTYYHTSNDYAGTSNWQQISSARATKIVAGGNGVEGVMLYAAFNTGTFQYSVNNGSWTRLTTAIPSLLACDGNGDVFAEFANGVFEDSRNGGWKQLTSSIASALTAGGDGRLYGSFTSGTWEWQSGTWTKLTTATTNTLSAGATDTLYASYGNGIWQWQNGTWTKLTTATTKVLAADTQDGAPGVVGSFGSGLFAWNGGWNQVNTAAASVLSGSTDSDYTYAAVLGTGTWEHDYAGWHQWSTSQATLLAET